MNTDDFISMNFNTALQIHEQCDKLNLSADKARLLTYIHFRLFKNETTEENVSLNHAEIAQVVDFLNDDGGSCVSSVNSGCYAVISKIPNKLSALDGHFRKDHGIEIRISSELNNRALFHRDSDFREQMIKLYRTKILPCLTEEELPA